MSETLPDPVWPDGLTAPKVGGSGSGWASATRSTPRFKVGVPPIPLHLVAACRSALHDPPGLPDVADLTAGYR